ncbi:MAG TPA: hypothetical protein VF909_15375 [Roseiflexaceae bacterium]
MLIRQLALVLLLSLMLAACATPAASGTATATPAASAPSDPPTVAPEPTHAPIQAAPTTSAPTHVPAAAPTQPPAPTSAPTHAPAPPTIAASPAAVPAAPPTATQAPSPAPSAGGELLFLRVGELWAFSIATGKVRKIAPGILDFAASPDGAHIALIRGEGLRSELWIVRRDGGDFTQLTHNNRAEAIPSWASDSTTLVFASSGSDKSYVREWPSWSAWCAASEVHLLNLADSTETSLAAGCDPVFSPDGKRIAFATPPTKFEPELNNGPMIVNSIRLINRQGQNGWDFAKAAGAEAPAPNTGRLVYAPAWSPDGKQLVYQRFLGYQALVDIDLSEIAGSFEGHGKPLADGAGWLLPARFAPGGRALAITENNYSDARGFGGYDNWSARVILLEGEHEIALPSGTIKAVGQQIDRLPRGQSVVWSPDGAMLAVELPPGWRPDLPPDEPLQVDERPGEVWLWTPGQQPAQKLLDGVDFASPLAWLP